MLFRGVVFNAGARLKQFIFFKVDPRISVPRINMTVHTRVYAESTYAHPEDGSTASCRHWTTDISTTSILIYTIGAGITAAAGTRLALQ